jgi:hypothetical protein
MRHQYRLIRTATRVTLVVALLGAFTLTCLAAPPARLTIADGPVQVLRGAAKFDADEGQALAAEDIVRTGPATRVARIEFADGRVLDLGPATQVLLLPPLDGAPAGVLAQGWAKLGAGDGGVARLAAPQVWVEAGGSALVRADADGALLVFAESRAARVLPRQSGLAAATLREGESWTRQAGAHRGVPQQVPRALADRLPRRATHFATGTDDAPEVTLALEAADLAPWLRAEPALLAQLRPRLSQLARRSMAGLPARSSAATAPRQARPDPRKARPRVMLAALRPGALVMPTVSLFDDSPSAAPAPRLASERVLAIELPTLAAAPPPRAAASAPSAHTASPTPVPRRLH